MNNIKKATRNNLINKFVVILTLWLLAIAGINLYIGYRIEVVALMYVALGIAILTFVVNALFLSLRFIRALHISPKQKEKYNR